MPLISVCIPSYNRPDELRLLLQGLASETYEDFEVVVSEDGAPEGDRVEQVVRDMAAVMRVPVRIFRNERTLGYDGNLRACIERADGTFCLFMADDDLLCAGALERIAGVLRARPDLGVVLRSWANVDRDTGVVGQEFRYFPGDRLFPAGAATIATFFRRSVFISGLVLRRVEAHRLATDRFDGTLLYQLYIAGCLLATHPGAYIAGIVALNRSTGRHFFGSAESERGLFEPGVVRPEHSRRFLAGMLGIARAVQDDAKLPVFGPILSDIGNYSYPFLLIQARNRRTFVPYAWSLARLGLWRSPLFHAYFALLLLAGPRLSEILVVAIKRAVGSTPRLGHVYAGDASSLDGP